MNLIMMIDSATLAPCDLTTKREDLKIINFLN